ncbi:hypothetical protein HanIR_Chr12g0615861 [Helianthus annuus]|nr:hypothetical protein HanIR_Chr12g0615861 [Helianthus annuus]
MRQPHGKGGGKYPKQGYDEPSYQTDNFASFDYTRRKIVYEDDSPIASFGDRESISAYLSRIPKKKNMKRPDPCLSYGLVNEQKISRSRRNKIPKKILVQN